MVLALERDVKNGAEVGAQMVVPSSRRVPVGSLRIVMNSTGQLVQGSFLVIVVLKKAVEI